MTGMPIGRARREHCWIPRTNKNKPGSIRIVFDAALPGFYRGTMPERQPPNASRNARTRRS